MPIEVHTAVPVGSRSIVSISDPSPYASAGRKSQRLVSVILSLAAAAVFFFAAAPNLGQQGLNYDELHQATGAFAYIGEDPEMFSIGSVFGLPVLNTSYSGAIKTGMYGLWLRVSRHPFTVRTWRLLGIGLAAAGLGVFVLLARRRLGNLPCLLFVLLVTSDATLLLATRHDWGPVALAFALRLVFLGLWLAGSQTNDGPPASVSNSAALALIVGIALFEKLSSIVLLVPLLLIVATRRQPSRARHLLAAGAGLFAGSLPLLLANLGSLVQQGSLISLAQIGEQGDRSVALSELFVRYLDLSRGAEVQSFILGREIPPAAFLSVILAVTALFATGVLALVLRRSHTAFPRSLTMLLAYLGIAAALHLLPARTWVHHWVLGTPFQYMAFALVVAGILGALPSLAGRRRVGAAATLAVLAVVLLARVPQTIALEGALLRGETSRAWHPSLTELGRFAADRSPEALFLASDWGVATQIYCLAQGRPDVVEEIFWRPTDPRRLEEILDRSGKSVFYLVRTKPPARVRPENSRRIEEDASDLAEWIEVPPEPEVRALEVVRVRKFVRR